MGANDDIDTAGLQVVEGLPDLLRRPEAAQQRDVHREALHPLDEGVVDLLREDGGRHEVGHLLTVLHGLEGGAQCDLGLSVAHVAADQAVHDLMALHVLLHRFDGEVLVDRLLVREHLLELLLPDGIRSEPVAGLRLPCRIELHEVTRDLLHRMLHTRAGLRPLRAAEFIQLRLRRLRARVLLDTLEPGRRQVEIAAVAVLDFDVVLRHALALDALDAAVDTDAVVLMHHVIADTQLAQLRDVLAVELLLLPLLLDRVRVAEHVALGEQHEALRRKLVARVQYTEHHHDGTARLRLMRRTNLPPGHIEDLHRQTAALTAAGPGGQCCRALLRTCARRTRSRQISAAGCTIC